MDAREAFKFAFLARQRAAGHSLEETLQTVKTACNKLEKVGFSDVGSAASGAADVAKTVTAPVRSNKLWYTLGAAPLLLGGTAAYGLNKLTDADATDVADVKRRELAETYNRMAQQLQRQRERREYKAKRQQSGQVYL